MKKWPWLLISLLVSVSAHAQLYRWVGPDGKITYSDTPPPSSVKQVEKKDVTGSSGPSTANLPYELAQAVKNSPVTLYTTTKCVPCEDARAMLKTRGIPYSEKTVSTYEDAARFKQIAGDGDRSFPLLTVGSRKQRGFESGAWDAMLTEAGYPQSNRLPANFSNPSAEALAPKAKTPAPAASTGTGNDKSSDALPDSPPAAGNAPPGFRF
jgi:glutaredoxin